MTDAADWRFAPFEELRPMAADTRFVTRIIRGVGISAHLLPGLAGHLVTGVAGGLMFGGGM